MYKKSAFVFWVTLALYLVTLFTASYVGVYLTYVAVPIIVVSGFVMLVAKPKKKTQEAIDSTKGLLRETKVVAYGALNEANNALDTLNKSLSEFNEKSELIRIRTQSLRDQKNSFKLEMVEPNVELKYSNDESEKRILKIKIEKLEKKIIEIDREIERIKRECELDMARRHRTSN